MNNLSKNELFSEILNRTLQDSTGCTEAGALGLAVATAFRAIKEGRTPSKIDKGKRYTVKEVLPLDVDEIVIEADRNVFKNVNKDTGFPVGQSKLKGRNHAIAAGLFCNPDDGLKLFEKLNEKQIDLIGKLANKVKTKVTDNWEGKSEVNIKATVNVKGHKGIVKIQKTHDNITYICRDNEEPLHSEDKIGNDQAGTGKYWEQLKDKMSFPSDILSYLEGLSEKDKKLIEVAIKNNKGVAEHGLKKEFGLGIGPSIKKLMDKGTLGKDIVNHAAILVAAAIDARMDGENVTVKACSGSGNQGLVATLPIVAVADIQHLEEDQLIKACALSYLTLDYIANHTGLLSAMCGCGCKAGIGAAAGITYLLRGDLEQIEASINLMAGGKLGMNCDGAKGGCSLKGDIAARAAVLCALLAIEGKKISHGIVAEKSGETIRNIGKLAEGMISTDKFIVEMMEGKKYKKKYTEESKKFTIDAMKERARYLYFLFEQMKEALGEKEAEKRARKAIYNLGKNNAKKKNFKTPEDKIKAHNEGINHMVFQSRTSQNEQKFYYCPLCEAWKDVGCSEKTVDLLCDIAMELDRGLAAYYGWGLDISKRIGSGDEFCHLIWRGKD